MLNRVGPWRFTSLRVAARGWSVLLPGRYFLIRRGGDRMDEELPRALPRDVPHYHYRQAAHFRALASTATTARLRARLLQEAHKQEQIARGEPVLDIEEG